MSRLRVVLETPMRFDLPRGVPTVIGHGMRLWKLAGFRAYARDCIRDSLGRGEAPYMPRVHYQLVLHDDEPIERAAAFDCANNWGSVAQKRIAYCDLGVSDCMADSIANRPAGQRVEYRYIYRTAVPRCGACNEVMPPEVPRCPTCSTWQPSPNGSV